MPHASVFSRVIRIGRLRVIDAAGRIHVFEGLPGPTATIRLHDRSLHWKCLLSPRFYVPEAYMNGSLTIEEGSLYDFLDVMTTNDDVPPNGRLMRLGDSAGRLLRYIHQYNPVRRSRRNVAHHYDLSDQLYELFLDSDRQYSCAYFQALDEDLETAQINKKRHIAAKLLLRPGQKVLDIGSGWGGLALYLAGECGAEVTGLTLSQEQLKVAQRRAAAAGLSDRVRFHLRDYREETEQYDRIVSVGMFEHVGKQNYDTFFRKCQDLLTDNGVMLLHTVGRWDGPADTNAWVWRHIFPGGYTPALSELALAIEGSGLIISDIEVLRIHYAETLRAWRNNFLANRNEVIRLFEETPSLRARFGNAERFIRMWEYYLAGFEASFKYYGLVVFQIQLIKNIDAVPLTRDYIYSRGRKVHSAAKLAEAAE